MEASSFNDLNLQFFTVFEKPKQNLKENRQQTWNSETHLSFSRSITVSLCLFRTIHCSEGKKKPVSARTDHSFVGGHLVMDDKSLSHRHGLGASAENHVPEIVSSGGMETRLSVSEVETQVVKLIEDLKSSSIDTQREAASHLRMMTRNNTDKRMVIGSCGAITPLVSMLHSTDLKSQEHAVTSLLNLSINGNNKRAIVDAGAIESFVHVLVTGTPEARENTAAAIYSLAKVEEYSILIGRSGAIVPLVELLKKGTPWGKKDAVTALFSLSTSSENKIRIVKTGIVMLLVEYLDPGVGMDDKAIAALLANLASIAEGRSAIAQAGGIPVLVEAVELGSPKGKEFAAAALCHLCSNSNRFCNVLLKEDAVPPLMALLHSGNARTKDKVHKILKHLRIYQHSNSGRD